MKEQDLTKLTVEELKSKAKTLRMVSVILLAAMFIMVISGIFFMMKTKSTALTLLPIAFLPLVIIFSSQLKKVQEELKKRAS